MFKKIFFIIIALLLVLGGICFYVARFEFRKPLFEVYFFYVHRGRSVFMRTPQGQTILIDGGQNSEVIRELTKVMPFYRRTIDVVIATRADAKNIGGLIDVLKRYKVGKIYEPILMGTSSALSAFKKVAAEKSISIEKLEKGNEFAIDNVQFRVLFPDPAWRFNKSNIPELAFDVRYGTTTLVLLGDVSTTIQKSLSKELGKVHLVEFAHGATKSRVSTDFLNKLDPEMIVSTQREETLRFFFK